MKIAAEMSRRCATNKTTSRARPHEIGPLSPRHRLRRVDRRTREGRYIAETEAALVAHLGGSACVSAPQRFLIERVAADMLRLELFDEKIAAGTMSDHDGRVMHALRNSVRLALRDLGLEAKAPPPKTLQEILAEEAAERADA